jgi:hypothetical protein
MKWTAMILHKKELSDSYGSLSVVRIVKSGLLGCARHVARMGETENAYRILVRKQFRM